MTTRVLPPDEWSRLADTEMGLALATINPAAVTVIVAEDSHGDAIGCWGLINFVHLEGMWVRADHRKRGTVLRRLWNAVCATAAEKGIAHVFTGARSDDVRALIIRRGGQPLPFESFVLPLKPLGKVS